MGQRGSGSGTGAELRRLVLVLALAWLPAVAAAQPSEETLRKWNQPVAPFRIVGDVYYVGAAEVASYLIATPAGHFLLDSGLAETVPQILANLERLGFVPGDVKYLLNSHTHFDHAGGIAELKARTGAAILLSAGDADQARRGGIGDFAFGDRFPFAPFAPDRLVADGEAITLGGVTLTALITPGHTRGCTTWTMQVEEAGRTLEVMFLCSLTAPGYRLVDNPLYPEIVADYRATFRRLEALPVDVFLANHASFIDLASKRERLCAHPRQNPFVDPEGWRRHLTRVKADFELMVVEQSR